MITGNDRRKCPRCKNGWVKKKGGGMKKCPYCKGTGKIGLEFVKK